MNKLQIKVAHKKKQFHGKTKTKLYSVWQQMKQRCYNKNDKGYKNYGGRGVRVCDEWQLDFEAFYNWAIENGYKEGLSIDKDRLSAKIGINPPIYSPQTCEWQTKLQQRSTQRINVEALREAGRNSRKNTPYCGLDLDEIDEAIECYVHTDISLRELTRKSGIARQTLSKHIKIAGNKIAKGRWTRCKTK
jgi:predicted DNA-binding protein (UPF0251 family)